MTHFNVDSILDIDPEYNYFDFQEFDNTTKVSNYLSFDDYKYSFETNRDKSIFLVNYNVRSFNSNFVQFFSSLLNCEPQILILTETWFTPDYKENINNYSSFHVVREGRSGGVSIYVKEILKAQRVDSFCICNEVIELCTVKIEFEHFIFFY